MPYPNEHAFRINPPSRYKSFRRENDKFGKGIDVIWGIEPDGSVEVQAIRFDASVWDYEDAKRWIKEHGYEPLESERATGESLQRETLQLPIAEELTSGSMDSAVAQVRDAFLSAFQPQPVNIPLWVVEVFEGFIIVGSDELGRGEFYKVNYTRDEGGEIQFAPREQWQVITLAYQTKESRNKPTKRKRFTERLGEVELDESTGAGAKRIRVPKVITADVVNQNGRLYPADVVSRAISELRNHLHESAGQGRLIQVLGEAGHPSDKGNRTPQILETVVVWDRVSFDGQHVSLSGRVLETSRGRDLVALMEGGVRPGVSLRGYGESKIINQDGRRVEQVTELHITGFDIVSEPGFPDALAVLESKQQEANMTIDELKGLVEKHPDMFDGLFGGKVEELSQEALKRVEESLRARLGISSDADLSKALQNAIEAKRQLEEQKRQAEISTAIAEFTKELPYGSRLNKAFVDAVIAAKPQSVDEVKALVESKRREYDALMAEMRLGAMGFRTQVLGPVFEQETGVPEYARAAYEFTEALVARGMLPRLDFKAQRKTPNQLYVEAVLRRFDECYKYARNGGGLIAESRMLVEAETTTDLSLPYSASRAILTAATAQLVASSVFDFGVTDQSPTRVYFEKYAEDTTVTKTVPLGNWKTMPGHNIWVEIGNRRIVPGTLVCKNQSETVTYVEGTDYVVDYENGRLKTLPSGNIGANDSLRLGYQYYAVRKGEMGVIERAKGQLEYVTLDCTADRLAALVSSEAIVFSRSQIGWDAVTRTMNIIIDQIRRRIDAGIFYLALAQVLSVPSNSGGTWTAGGSLDDLASYIGAAKVKVDNRYYTPTFVLMSKARSNDFSNWHGFDRTGFPTAELKPNGYVARVKGLDVYESTEFPDNYILVGNRELVLHRVYMPMVVKGPYPTYDQTTLQMKAGEEYYVEEYNGSVAPVPEKGAYVAIVTQ